MRTVKFVSLMTLTLLCFLACKKKRTTPVIFDMHSTNSTPTQQKITLPITNGSYWVYDMNYINVNTQARTFMGRDSFIVENDVVVNNNTYKQIRKYSVIGNNPVIGPVIDGLFRDSAGYNVTPI